MRYVYSEETQEVGVGGVGKGRRYEAVIWRCGGTGAAGGDSTLNTTQSEARARTARTHPLARPCVPHKQNANKYNTSYRNNADSKTVFVNKTLRVNSRKQ